MSIYEMVKETLTNHKEEVQYFQWASMNAMASFIFPEYVCHIKERMVPIHKILVPEMRAITDIVDPESSLVKKMSESLIDDMINNTTFKGYIYHLNELQLFRENKVEILKCIYDSYIIPNVCKYIPEVISKKFGLDDPNQQLFQENRDVDLFPMDKPSIPNLGYEFVCDQTILQLLMMLPSVQKEQVVPESHKGFKVKFDQILTIDNDVALCPIHLTMKEFGNQINHVAIEFATSSRICWASQEAIVTTGISNKVMLTRLV